MELLNRNPGGWIEAFEVAQTSQKRDERARHARIDGGWVSLVQPALESTKTTIAVSMTGKRGSTVPKTNPTSSKAMKSCAIGAAIKVCEMAYIAEAR